MKKPVKIQKSASDWDPSTARFFAATCMKDEGPFIIEWLAWHKSIGIQDFVVFSNDCSDGTDLILDRLEEMDQLRHLPNPALATGSGYFQPAALALVPFLSEYRKADFFISFDVDEFINVRVGTGQMSDLLTQAGPFDALSMCELNHGSNNQLDFEPGFVIDQFPCHQTERPGRWKARRGVKTITRLGPKVEKLRNHRPDFVQGEDELHWLDGSGKKLAELNEDSSLNGVDVRSRTDLVILDHYPLRSLHSYLVKMFRGDVVIKDKQVSRRYWRTRNANEHKTSELIHQRAKFEETYNALMNDSELARLHENACKAHRSRIKDLLKIEEFQERKAWILENSWAS